MAAKKPRKRAAASPASKPAQQPRRTAEPADGLTAALLEAVHAESKPERLGLPASSPGAENAIRGQATAGDEHTLHQSLREREERLQAILSTTADAILTMDANGLIQFVNPAAEQMFGYTAAEMLGQNLRMLVPSAKRDEHDDYLARCLKAREIHLVSMAREVEGRRKDGSVFPIDLAVSEIGSLNLFTGIIHDLTQRKRLAREVVEIASLEQQRIGSDLHDSVGQELTALNLLAKDLAESLRGDAAKAGPLLERMIQGLQRSQQELRGVLRGLLPVPVDHEGLTAALTELADYVQQEGKTACAFDCPTLVSVADNQTAAHLYYIAREAVYNAIKHAQAQQIRIRLHAEDATVLCVHDNGVGIPARIAKNRGLGLRIMHNRAAIIGAALTVAPAEPTGTVITCVLPRRDHEPETDQDESPHPDR